MVERVVIADGANTHQLRIVREVEAESEGRTHSHATDSDLPTEYYLNGYVISETSFQELYQNLIGLRFDGEAEHEPRPAGRSISFVYHLVNGSRRTVSFYPYDSTYHAVFRDGIAEFLIRSSKLESILKRLETTRGAP
jgi:hypothetical protein